MKLRNLKTVTITHKGEKSLVSGHPWVYQGEIIRHDEIIDG